MSLELEEVCAILEAKALYCEDLRRKELKKARQRENIILGLGTAAKLLRDVQGELRRSEPYTIG